MNRLKPKYQLQAATLVLEAAVNNVTEGKINLSPFYQRDFVWDVSAQKNFIQNMVNGFPFGSIIINRDDNCDEQMFMECVDGKQRLTAMVDFVQNKFSITAGDNELFFSDLEPSEVRKFNNIGVPVYYVYNLPSTECAKLFIDLNSYVPQSDEHMNMVKLAIDNAK